MPSTELKRILNRLNLDDSYYNLLPTDYVDALNITKDALVGSQDIAITNVVGNQLVAYTLPSGTNAVIGAKADVLRNRVFEFIWNSNDYHSIVIFDETTRTRTKLIENLTDTSNVDVLQFTRTNKIIHCDIIYRDTEEGDLLFWTDGNVSPRKLNVKHIQDGDYTYIKVPFIELAKMPPISPVQAVYGTDATRNANALRKKLVMATYRWVYDDFEKSTFTTYSKIPLPIGYYGSDNDTDNTKNNFITFTVETGDENVTDIEIAVRFNNESTWQDFILAISLNKEQLGIPNNTTYDYLFYNDAIYPPIDVEEATQLFDWCPKKAKSQCLPNGNVIALGAITENYDNYPVDELDVTITTENVKNVPPDTDPASLTYIIAGGVNYVFTVAGSVPTGTHYQIIAFVNFPTPGVITLADYTSIGGDTTSDVATGLYATISPTYQFSQVGSSFTVNFPGGGSILQVNVQNGSGGGGSSISTEKTWIWDANYLLGQAYKDEQGRLMPGVTTLVNPVDSDNDYMVTTPSFELDGSDVMTPVIYGEVNHVPYPGSVTYAWVRRRMTYANVLFYMTCDYQDPSDGFLYFCLANIEKYKEANTQFIYGTAPISSDSRIKIVAGISGGGYDGDIYNQDYEILGTVTMKLSGGSTDDDQTFIKVKKPSGSISPAYKVNMLVMVYTPMANPTDAADSVYWEWGEEYDTYTGYTIPFTAASGTFTVGETITGGTSGATAIVVADSGTELGVSDITGTFTPGETITGGTSTETATLTSVSSGVLYHRGMDQDQTSFQPATFSWEEGDFYFHDRTMYSSILASAGPSYPGDTVPIMDANYSDFFASAVNDNGRGLTIERDARETYFPATIRFSREYQQNTNINQTNRFLFLNFIDLDRSFGSILKMSIRDRYIRIGQQFKIGVVPIFNQISKDSANNTLTAATDVLLNPVQYYLGDFGVGDAPECWTDYNYSSYFFDTNRGIWCRLSRDGLTEISILYKINSWATDHGVTRGSTYKIYGTYDPKSNNCIFAFEATNDDSAYTLTFDEETNSFESFMSYHPEFMCTLGSLLITYKDGGTWTHDSDTYNSYYGTAYPSYITPVFNQDSAVKKKYLSLGYQSNKIWSSPTKGDVKTSTVNPQTNFQQESKILESNFEEQENVRVASINYDMNSMTDETVALWEGDYLGGSWCMIKFVCPVASATELVHFNMPYLNFIPSPRNF